MGAPHPLFVCCITFEKAKILSEINYKREIQKEQGGLV